MKQVNDCLDRFFANKEPIKHKIQARWDKDFPKVILIFHYHHLLLAYDTENKKVLHQWWEVLTDKRNLDAALMYIKNKYEKDKEE